MKNKNELKDLLDRLKGEVSGTSSYDAARQDEAFRGSFEGAPRAAGIPEAGQRGERPEQVQAYGRPELQRLERARVPEGANLIWSENKETMLFGILASLVAILGGILAGLEYLILAGTVSFVLFSFITVLTLFGYYLRFNRKNSDDGRLNSRVDQLSRRLEALAERGFSGQSRGPAGAQVRDSALEQKVEELRTLVRSLAKAVEGGGGKDR